MRRPGLTKQVLFVALAPAVLIAVLVTAYFTWARIAELERSLHERGEAIARQLAPASEYGVISGNQDFLLMLAETALRESEVVSVSVTNAAGDVLLARRRPGREGAGAPVLTFSAAIRQSRIEVSDFAEAEPKVPVRVLGSVLVELSQAEMIAQRNRFLIMSLLITFGGLAVGGLLALQLSRRVTKPVLALAEAVQRIGEGDLDVQVPASGDAEIATLQQGINAMAGSLKEMRDNLQGLVDVRTADLLRAKEAAEAANRAKSVFLANISHELRTPLHAILSLASFGVDKIDRAPKDTLLQYFSLIHQSGRRLLDELNDLLDMAKLEAGRMRYNMQSRDVAAIVERVAAEYTELLRDKNLNLRIDAVGCATKTVCDELRIGQVIHNLLSNAIRFSPDGGTVRISFGSAVVPRDGPPGAASLAALEVRVSDEGVGIPEGETERIFQKFMQSSRTADSTGGTGLGLAICREIVSAHGGEIWAQNNPQQGSTFAFALPLLGRLNTENQHESLAS